MLLDLIAKHRSSKVKYILIEYAEILLMLVKSRLICKYHVSAIEYYNLKGYKIIFEENH